MGDCNCGTQVSGAVSGLEQRLNLLHRFLLDYLAPAERYETHRLIPSVVTADGSGDAIADLGSPVQGTAWYVERVSTHASAGAPSVGVFVGPQSNVDNSFRQDFTSAVQDNIADEVNPIYVQAGSFLTIQWAGATASATLYASVQVRVVKLGKPTLVA